jgi:glycosyltransferase involved in cell wall biosynthesis
VQQFTAGFLVPVHSTAALAWCLRQLALEPGLWQRQRQAALQLASTELDWGAYAERSALHYRQLLEAAA